MAASEYLDERIETATHEEIQKLQDARLAKQLDYVFVRSVFYQEKFRAADLRREHYRCLGDLQRFPFTTKEELRESQAAFR